MAPELLYGNPASVASDLYAVAVMACEVLLGAHPFDADGEQRDVTVMFVDLQGYTRFSEHSSPEEVVTMLNRFFRVVVGTKSFGVFTPALLGLIFRDTRALPWGLGIFAGTVVVGWVFRKVLDRFGLLMVPRTAILLTMVCLFLVGVVITTSRVGVHITGYVALFPLVILTHMVERFWTVETEDGTKNAFKTLMGTVMVAVAVALTVGHDSVSRWLFRFPETLTAAVAALLVLGRYTGYRLTELYRFPTIRSFANSLTSYRGAGDFA